MFMLPPEELCDLHLAGEFHNCFEIAGLMLTT
jgi:hypothetical protein